MVYQTKISNMDDEQYRSIVIGSYVQGTEVDTGFFARGYLVGYKLMDKTDPNSIAAEIEKDHSHSVFITMDSMKLVSRYETLLKKLEEYGLKYIDGKIIGRPQPKFAIGDIARHKNYSDKAGDVIITYVCEHGYTYMFANGSGGGTFGFSAEKDYNLIKSNNNDQ